MNYIKKLFAVSMILITVSISFTKVSFSGDIILSSQGDLTTHQPESVSTPEKDIPVEAEKVKPEKAGGSWLWAVVALAVVAGVAAGAGGGGDGGGSSGGSKGSINMSW